MRRLLAPVGVGLMVPPLLWLAKCPLVLPGAWNTMKSVSLRLAKEFAAAHICVLVTRITPLPAGITPPGGSKSQPQPWIVALSASVSAAVLASCTSPFQLLLGQSASNSFNAMSCGPVRKRTISFMPSAPPGHSARSMQASTRMLSISRHCVGICALSAVGASSSARTTASFGFGTEGGIRARSRTKFAPARARPRRGRPAMLTGLPV